MLRLEGNLNDHKNWLILSTTLEIITTDEDSGLLMLICAMGTRLCDRLNSPVAPSS